MRLSRLLVVLVCLLASALAAAPDGGNSSLVQPLVSYGAVFLSRDGGATFTRVLIPGASINALAVDPANSSVVYAATSAGLYQSKDAGLTWTLAKYFYFSEFYKTADFSTPMTALAVDPNSPCMAFASNYFETADCGSAWARTDHVPFAWGVTAIAVGPTSPRAVYFAATVNTSSPIGRCTDNNCDFSYPLSDVRVLAAAPSDGCVVYAANTFGEVVRNSDCSDWNWSQVGATLDAAVRSFVVHPTNPLIVFAGTESGTIYRSISADGPWVVKASLGAPVRGLAYNSGNPSIMYAVAGSTLYRSVDAGGSWSALSALGGSLSALATSAADPSVLFAGSSGGEAWAPVITAQPVNRSVVSGGSTALSIVAAGSAPLSYQWYQGQSPDTSVPVGSATSPAFTTPPLNADTNYWVRVANLAGSADSATATVSVGVPRPMTLAGDLNFGTALIHTAPTRTMTISNPGNAPLTVTGITYPTGFSGSWTGVIAPGGVQDVTVTFSPVAVTSYGGTLIVNADHTSGTNTLAASGAGGTPPPAPVRVFASANDASATVGFYPPMVDGGSPLTGYIVTSNPPGGIDLQAGQSTTYHQVTGLANGTPYTFTVVATNALGSGPPSLPTNSVIPAPAFSSSFPHRSPAQGAAGVTTSPKLEWDFPLSNWAQQYCIDTVNNGSCDTVWIDAQWSVSLSGLSPGTTYYWHVRATSAGVTIYAEGDPTAYWSFTTTSTPSSVSLLAGLMDYPSHQALGINSNGIAVGTAFGGSASGGPATLAERFNPASQIYRLLIPPFDSATEALSINDGGVISGYGAMGSGTRVYAGGGNWLPQLPGGVNQLGGSMNNGGEVAGTTYFDSSNVTPGHATLWVPDGPGYSAIDLGLFAGKTIQPRGMAPNRSGAGRIIVGRRAKTASTYEAVQWKDGAWIELEPSDDPNPSSWANDVSDEGIAVGVVGQSSGNQGWPALWDNGQFRSLRNECAVVNDSLNGEARGIATTPDGRTLIVGSCADQPVIWYSDGPDRYVAELLPLLAGDTKGDAFDVNAAGQIVGRTMNTGGQSHAVIWTFSPPPPLLTMTRTGTGTGSVTGTPSGIDCGTTCSFTYPQGQIVTLTANPAPGSVFSGFAGDADCYDGQVTMSKARGCTATFSSGTAGGPISPLYLTGTPGLPAVNTIRVVQGSAVTNSWPTFGSSRGDYEREIAVTDKVKTIGRFNEAYSRSYSLTGTFFGADLLDPFPVESGHPELLRGDGATDGTHHYAIGHDYVYQFDSNWENPTVLFSVSLTGYDKGITYDPSNGSLWIINGPLGLLRNYSKAGQILSSFPVGGYDNFGGLALDPADSTLWVSRTPSGQDLFEQYSKQGILLQSIAYPNLQAFWNDGAEFARLPAGPGDFFKIGPTNWATGKSLGTVLTWTSSAAATSYEYCIDTTNDNNCDSWIDVGTSTSVSPGSLTANTTYFWQVRAIISGQPVYADGLAPRFWRFVSAPEISGAFSKNLPTDGATAQPLNVVLSWTPAAGATGYEYCIDVTNDNVCTGNWVPVGNQTSVGLVALPANTNHYWQVRAISPGATVYADGNLVSAWTFRTQTLRSPILDLNADGNGDALLYDPSSGNWQRQIAQTNGTFVSSSGSFATGWTVTPATFDNDASSDVFLFNSTTGAWEKKLGSAGNFVTESSGTWWNGWQRHVMDLDGDGISDVFLYDPTTGVWFKCISTPTGFTYYQGGWNPEWEIYPMTLNADALGDMFLYSRTSGRWFWVLGAAGGGFTYPVTDGWFNGWNLYPGHFNSDNLSDLLLHHPATGTWFVAMNNGTGFTYTSGGWSLGWTPYIGDLDNDQDDDVFLHDPATGNWFELLSNGTGALTNAGSGTWSLGWDVHLTDFNADGRTDVLLYNPSTGVWYQARNFVTGTFAYSSGSWLPGWTVIVRNPSQ